MNAEDVVFQFLAATVLEELDRDRVLACFQTDRSRLLYRSMHTIVIHNSLRTDVQLAAIVGDRVERVVAILRHVYVTDEDEAIGCFVLA